MNINLTNVNGVKLKTSGKYCTEDINVIPKLEESTITPTKSVQIVTPAENKAGLSKVVVNEIPDDYIIPSGTQQITENGTYNISSKASVVVNVDTAKPEQTKTVEITSNGTTKITADSGKVLSEATVIVNVPSEQPTLNAPTISLSDSMLTITNPATNGNFVTGYKIYNGETLVATVTTTTVDLSTYITTAGTHTITVKAAGTNFVDSAASNTQSFVVIARYSITPTLTNVTAASGNATDIAEGETVTLTYTANDGYNLPDSVSVSGATGSWNKSSGTLTLSNATGNVTFTIAGVSIPTLSTPTISLVSGTTIQIESIDNNASTIEVYADGTKIGEVTKS